MERQDQSKENKAEFIPKALEEEIRELNLAIKRAILYPAGHPMRVKSSGEIHELLQHILLKQENHSVTSIEDMLHIDRQRIDAEGHRQLGGMSTDLARKLKRRGIRSVVFTPGIEPWELERFLDIMVMTPKEVVVKGGASRIMYADGDVPHVEIVDIKYEGIQFVSDDDIDDIIDARAILMSYLNGKTEVLADEAYAYLLSVIESPDAIADLIEESAGYDGIHDPNESRVIRCMDRLLRLEDQFIYKEKKDFQRKLFEATLEMDSPVKDAIFSALSGRDILAELMKGFSVDEIAMFAVAECETEDPEFRLRRMIDELIVSDQELELGAYEGLLADVEQIIHTQLSQNGREAVFNDTVVPILEEVFVEFEVGKLETEQFGLERLLGESHPLDRYKDEESLGMLSLFALEDEAIMSSVVLLEMMESEDNIESYSGIVDQLEGTLDYLITESGRNSDVKGQYIIMALRIIDSLSEHANIVNDKSWELQQRAKDAIDSIVYNRQVMINILQNLSTIEHFDWEVLKRFIHQAGGKAIPILVDRVLKTEDSSERRILVDILVSMGPVVVPELRKQLAQCDWSLIVKGIIPILSDIDAPEALDCLAEILDHPHQQVRRSAIRAIAKSKNNKATDLILGKIWDKKEDESIRQLAISVLSEMGNDHVLDELEKILSGGKLLSKKAFTFKHEAINALAVIGGERSISLLLNTTKRTPLILGRRRVEEMQLQAVEALKQIGTESAINALHEISRKKRGKLRDAADKALKSHR
jgi:hypothetical protein